MKLYSAPAPAPNPRRVRMFAAEKGIELDEIMLDLRQNDHKGPDHVARNSLAQVPVLELDDGTTIAETVSICRYLEAIHPQPSLFGQTPRDIALIDMWIRRIEFQIGEPVRMFWRHAHPATAALLTQHQAFGASNRDVLDRSMAWFDKELADGRDFVVGTTLTMADIAAVTIVDFAALIGLDPLSCHSHVQKWHGKMSARPSYTEES